MRREKEEQRKRKIERALNEESEPKKKHFLEDPNYVSETAALVESVASAVDEGTLPWRVRGRCARLLLMNLFGRTGTRAVFPIRPVAKPKNRGRAGGEEGQGAGGCAQGGEEARHVVRAHLARPCWMPHVFLTLNVCGLVRHQGRGGAERQQRRRRRRRQERQRSGLCEQRRRRQQPCKQGLKPCKKIEQRATNATEEVKRATEEVNGRRKK